MSRATAGADALAASLLAWDLDVRRHAVPREKLGAIVLVLDELDQPEDLEEPVLAAGILAAGPCPERPCHYRFPRRRQPEDPAAAAARQGVDGLLRSLAQELRAGATGNGILLADGVAATSPSALAALRFLLSGRSAFVDGQFLTVNSADGHAAGRLREAAGRQGRRRHRRSPRHRRSDRQDPAPRRCHPRRWSTSPRQETTWRAVANEVHGTALQLDISRDDAGQRILEHALQRHGRLDIVVHNAGITSDKLLANMDHATLGLRLNVNIASQLRINEALLASEHFRNAPRIVSVASTSGIAGNRGQTNYAASKGGVMGMVRASAPLLAERGGSINAVAPGFIETDMTARIPVALREAGRRLNSLRQGGQPADVAEAIAFLASDAAGGINGGCCASADRTWWAHDQVQPVILGEMPSLSKLYVNAAAQAARRRVLGIPRWRQSCRRPATKSGG